MGTLYITIYDGPFLLPLFPHGRSYTLTQQNRPVFPRFGLSKSGSLTVEPLERH